MMDILILRFDAPLMSFGAPIVDRHGVVQPYPGLALMTGLLGNALGFHHAESERLQRLQDRLRYACRLDRRGQLLRDYQTVDLSKPYMDDELAWTTRGELERRKGGTAADGTHIRLRDYWADAVYTIALSLAPQAEDPSLGAVEQALQFPERPLFLGRKCCLPATPVLLGRMQAEHLVEALHRVPLSDRAHSPDVSSCPAWWPVDPREPVAADAYAAENVRLPVTDARDWSNQIHVGERWVASGEVNLTKPGKKDGA